MTTTLKKLSALILALGTIFILSFPSIAHAADTGGSDHFELTVVENKDSKSGAEIADLTIQNISGKTGTNVTFKADLPTIFHDKDMKKVTVNVGTLKAGDAKTYQVNRKTDGTVTTTPLPTTGNLPTTGATNTATKTSTPLPSTGEKMTPVLMVLGLGVLAAVLIIAIKHRKATKNVLALVLLIVGLGSATTVNAAEETYHHRDEVRNHAVELAGTTHVFHLAAEGDFEGDKGEPGVSNNFTITYYINDKEVKGEKYKPDGYIAGVKTTYLPIPTDVTEIFSGWYDNKDCTGDVITSIAKDDKGDKTFYGKTTPKTYTVTFESNGGSDVPSATVNHGDTVSKPSDPAKDDATPNVTAAGDASAHDFILKGWYTDEALTTPFDFDTPITADITLYAKWGLPIVELAGHDDGTLGTQFDRVWLSNSWWRILKADMDTDATNDNQTLIIKEQALTDQETGDGSIDVQFDTTATNSTSPYFHDDSTSTGYGESHLKAVIDSYYNTAISPINSNYVLPVDLDLPNWSRYQNAGLGPNSGTSLAYNNWYWQDWQPYCTDNRFPTSLTPLTTLKQQAFALSFGDIQSLDKSTFSATGDYSTLLDFTAIDANYPYFWLRSAGGNCYDVGAVFDGSIDFAGVYVSQPVRPALAIQLD
ncbi:LPXTG-motif cell wall anchor domain-containing protein/Listeria/Bacterioides repeat-containing protein [Lactococcus chungangensis CAU 28 = DSM 22330]|uniref:LPXTG-motif cell wall anchor domain-containing protein/Listeria/Bacterioides repeat-containing protein n=3 Tax=Pseudolactococcus chungangensis TaxID=451457 RepID=A0A1K2HE08_9LACT|nr:LPXTG-motif cell wall anchor domain-containing protein/Listeria/Bacterioides repeat-containing protein [Lactococcus chungangensis CAU 28 = DSM 22330]